MSVSLRVESSEGDSVVELLLLDLEVDMMRWEELSCPLVSQSSISSSGLLSCVESERKTQILSLDFLIYLSLFRICSKGYINDLTSGELLRCISRHRTILWRSSSSLIEISISERLIFETKCC